MGIIQVKKTIKIRNTLIDLSTKKIMGILNITPDSFYQGSRVQMIDEVLKKTDQFLKEGADFIDIGGYSSRPGAKEISLDTELQRIIEPINQVHANFPEAIISIDTFRPEVASKAIEAGASMINDITAGGINEKMFEIVASYDVPYIIMHMKESPKTMQLNPQYEDVVMEVVRFFSAKIEKLKKLGISDIIIDPGFGFGKTSTHNFQLLKNLGELKLLNIPVMVGLSRKSMVYKTLNISPDEALNGTTALNTIALLNGADVLRVHDAKEAKQVIELVDLYSHSVFIQ